MGLRFRKVSENHLEILIKDQGGHSDRFQQFIQAVEAIHSRQPFAICLIPYPFIV
jgi:hypothetical protein